MSDTRHHVRAPLAQRGRHRQRHDTSHEPLEGLPHDSGQPLSSQPRQHFESRFDHSFSSVRIHASADAARTASSVGARAFTIGSDIVFGDGQYSPDSAEGRALLAHELAHVVQNDSSPQASVERDVSSPGDPAEQEAARAEAMVETGMHLDAGSAPAAVVSRAPATGGTEARSDPFGTGGGFFSFLSGASNIGESVADGLADYGRLVDSKGFGFYGDGFGALSGGMNFLSGASRLIEGGGASAGLDMGKGLLDLASNAGGLMGNGNIEGSLGMMSGGIDVARGLYNAIGSDNLDEATKGAYDAAGGVASIISGYGDRTGNPLLMGGGRALGAGLKVGEGIVSVSDSIAQDRGYFHDDDGNAQSGSAEAADWGRSVDDFFGDAPVLDQIGGFLGGATAIAGGIGNSALTYGGRAVEAIGDFFSGPSEAELQKLRKSHPEVAWMYGG